MPDDPIDEARARCWRPRGVNKLSRQALWRRSFEALNSGNLPAARGYMLELRRRERETAKQEDNRRRKEATDASAWQGS